MALITYGYSNVRYLSIPTASTSVGYSTYIFKRGTYTKLHAKLAEGYGLGSRYFWGLKSNGVFEVNRIGSTAWVEYDISSYEYIICMVNSSDTQYAYYFYVS